MEKKVFRKKLLILLMIISIVATDFFILGSNLLTYSSDISDETNNPNVEFLAYFKNDYNERVDSIQKSIKDDNLKLYAEIIVKNEGYLNEGTSIEIENSNFNLKNNISSPYIKEINGNTVVLKQITAGENVEIELNIEPIITEKLTTYLLSQISIVKLNGSYTGSTETGIQYGKQVCIDFQVDETAEAELQTEIITNKVIAVNGTNKRMVQLLIKSRLTENQFPIQQTKINASIPQFGEQPAEVSVMAIRTAATNGKIQLDEESWSTENGTVEIIIKNDADSNNEINWKKNAYDELIVTYLYPETVDASKIEIETNSEVKLYNDENTYTAKEIKNTENQELNSAIMGMTEVITQEMYKGQIYANIDSPYSTKTTIVVTDSNIADKIIINEGPDTFGKDQKEASVNTKYVSTKINKAEMLSILGQDGYIQIKNGGTVSTVNKETETDENGNIFINYQEKVSEIEITTSKPQKEGILEIEHSKVIAENSYTKAQLNTVKTLNVKSRTTATLNETIVVENATEQGTLELKETISKAELTIENNKNTLSTTGENEVTLGITLITDGTQYDLYKNPEFNLQFPESVENVELLESINKQNADEFAVSVGNYNESARTIKVKLTGEQTIYPESALTQSYIQLNLKVTLSKLATDKLDKITMIYTNENASKYYGETADFGIIEKIIQISGQPGLMKQYNLNLNKNTSVTETIKQQITPENAGQTISFETLLLNNTGSNMKNIKIVGKLPTTKNKIQGKDENTLETTLTNILAENAKIYYTENVNATVDVEDISNGWTDDLSVLTNAKLYLIKLEELSQGSKYAAKVNVKIPNRLQDGLISYTEYKVIYDTDHATNIEETSKDIQLATGLISNVKVNLEAKVGGQKLTDGNTVKVGEVIKYIVTVENEDSEPLENVTVKALIPEGTVLVEPMGDEDGDGDIDYIYYEGYYLEKAEITEKSETVLLDKNTYKMEYEVRVKKDLSIEEIVNQAIVTYENSKVESSTIKNKIQDADIRVTVKNINIEEKVIPNSLVEYTVYIENLSDQKLTNAQVKIIADNLEYVIINNTQYNIEKETINIDEIEANGVKALNLMAKVKGKDDIKQPLSFVANVTLNGDTYRSNEIIKEFKIANATINLSSNPQSGSSIKEGDTVRYIVDIQNKGDLKELFINTKISEYLQVQEIKVDGKTYSKTNVEKEEIISNFIEMMPIKFESNENKKIEIIAKVTDTPKETVLITNKVTLMYTSIYEIATSNEVTHILAGNMTNVGDVKNTVSGLVWLDQNENGKKDSNEAGIKDIIVKIYDVEEGCYFKDSDGKVIQTSTNGEGKYTLSGIEDGLYRIVIEDNYETTTAQVQNILVDGQNKKVIVSDKINIQDHVRDIDIGLKEKDKEDSGNNNDGENVDNNNQNNNSEGNVNTISGYAWLDEDRDGQRDTKEKGMAGVKVRLYSGATKNYLKDKNGQIIEVITDENGKYIFNNIEIGKYIILFQFNMGEYDVTKYMVEGDSKAVLKKVKIDGEEKVYAVTDIINVQSDIYNINIGLSEKLIFDLELDKYISKIVIQDGKETKTYNYEDATLAKVEIHRKRLQGSLVVLEYTIKIKNNGEIPGYAKNIVDYLPSGLTFGSEMNKDWYVSNGYLHTKGLENVIINPGEEKELKLTLTKTMTNENTGLINNRAEIYQDYNDYGTLDKDSTPNNQAQNEDDMGAVDVIIGPATGGNITVYIILVIINIVLIGIAIKLMIRNSVIKKSTKGERR